MFTSSDVCVPTEQCVVVRERLYMCTQYIEFARLLIFDKLKLKNAVCVLVPLTLSVSLVHMFNRGFKCAATLFFWSLKAASLPLDVKYSNR